MPAPVAGALIDRVDGANRAIGVVRRADVFEQRANFRTVHILVTNPAGSLLVQQLSPTRDRHPGLWGSSVAGYLFAGETYAAAAQRRLRDELGVEMPLAPCGVVPVDDLDVVKFVGVFSGCSEGPFVIDRSHTAKIEFRPVTAIEDDLRAGLSTYTDTFVEVFTYWRQHTAV